MTHRQPTPKRERSFGIFIRAKRLCYCWVPCIGCYMRTRDIEGGFLIELAPPESSQLKDCKQKHYYRVFDTEEQANQMVKLSPVLSAIKSVKRYFQIKLDDHGNAI